MLTARRRVYPLDRAWNCQDYDKHKKRHSKTSGNATPPACAATAKILHYSGAMKPWFLPQDTSASLEWRGFRRT